MRSRVTCGIERPGTSFSTTETVAGFRPKWAANFFRLVVPAIRCFSFIDWPLCPGAEFLPPLFFCRSRAEHRLQGNTRENRSRQNEHTSSSNQQLELRLCLRLEIQADEAHTAPRRHAPSQPPHPQSHAGRNRLPAPRDAAARPAIGPDAL